MSFDEINEMSHQTVILSSFEEYLADGGDSLEGQAERKSERIERLARFPYAVDLFSYNKLDEREQKVAGALRSGWVAGLGG